MEGPCGDKAWLMAVMAQHERGLLRYAASIVGPSTAEDVVQDVFVELCRQRRDDVEGHLGAWLFKVCRNKGIDTRRRMARGAGDEGIMRIEDRHPSPLRTLESKEDAARVESALATLSPRDREVISLKFAAGMSYKEIAEILDITVNHVGVMLHEALRKLRKNLHAEASSTPMARSL